MIRLVVFGFAALLAAQAQNPPPAQAARGEKLFFEGAKGACSMCHALAGKGTPAGPDLTRLARIPPRAIATAVRASRTQYVQTVKLKNDEVFPGMPGPKDDKVVQFYDLSKKPPELRKIDKAEIVSTTDNATWKHPPESAGLTNEEMADIIAYIRWASYKDRSAVDPDDLQ